MPSGLHLMPRGLLRMSEGPHRVLKTLSSMLKGPPNIFRDHLRHTKIIHGLPKLSKSLNKPSRGALNMFQVCQRMALLVKWRGVPKRFPNPPVLKSHCINCRNKPHLHRQLLLPHSLLSLPAKSFSSQSARRCLGSPSSLPLHQKSGMKKKRR